MGEGIRSEAARKIVKKTIRIGMPFMFSSESEIIIFNKDFCINVQQKYTR